MQQKGTRNHGKPMNPTPEKPRKKMPCIQNRKDKRTFNSYNIPASLPWVYEHAYWEQDSYFFPLTFELQGLMSFDGTEFPSLASLNHWIFHLLDASLSSRLQHICPVYLMNHPIFLFYSCIQQYKPTVSN